jgi:hypothetical protein
MFFVSLGVVIDDNDSNSDDDDDDDDDDDGELTMNGLVPCANLPLS